LFEARYDLLGDFAVDVLADGRDSSGSFLAHGIYSGLIPGLIAWSEVSHHDARNSSGLRRSRTRRARARQKKVCAARADTVGTIENHRARAEGLDERARRDTLKRPGKLLPSSSGKRFLARSAVLLSLRQLAYPNGARQPAWEIVTVRATAESATAARRES
jgi:hypothetical protein